MNKIDRIKELIASIESYPGKDEGRIYPVWYWLDRIKKYPNEFHLDRDYGLMWLGLQVWTGRSKDGRYLIEKWKEYSAK